MVGLAFGMLIAALDFGLGVLSLSVGAVLDAYTPSSNSTNATITWNLGLGNETAEPTEEPTPLPTMRGFMLVEIILLGVTSIGLVCAVMLRVLDRSGRGLLSESATVRASDKGARALLNT